MWGSLTPDRWNCRHRGILWPILSKYGFLHAQAMGLVCRVENFSFFSRTSFFSKTPDFGWVLYIQHKAPCMRSQKKNRVHLNSTIACVCISTSASFHFSTSPFFAARANNAAPPSTATRTHVIPLYSPPEEMPT